MVFIKSFEEGSITVLDRNSDRVEDGTTLPTHKPLMSFLADPTSRPPPRHYTSLFKHRVIEDSKPGCALDATVLSLKSFGRAADPTRCPSFSNRRTESVSWGSTLDFPGGICYTPLYWEWTEDVLSRFKENLARLSIYDAVFASLFLYDPCPTVFNAFCEIWSYPTNIAFTSKGEISFSLLDLQVLSGLPCFGELLDEVVPTIDELNESKPVNGIHHCRYWLYAFHKLSKRNPGSPVKVIDWVSFWFKGARKYEAPPSSLRRSASGKGSSFASPLGSIDLHADLTADIRATANNLGVPEAEHERIYLAGFLSAWLCKFIVPRDDPSVIRPEVFKAACMMACGVGICLSIPVLANIYSALGGLWWDRNVSVTTRVFPSHFLFAWFAAHFHTNAGSGLTMSPPMVEFSGLFKSKPFTDAEARALLDNPDFVHMSRFVPAKDKRQRITDDRSCSLTHRQFLASVRTCNLISRYRNAAIAEPYYPYRFSRQFGYVQSTPDDVTLNVRNTYLKYDLKKAARFWKESTFPYTSSTLTIPSKQETERPSVTQGYADWWAMVFDGASGDDSVGAPPSDRLSLWSRRICPADDGAPAAKRNRLEPREPALGESSANPVIGSPTCSRDRFWRTARPTVPSPDEAVHSGEATSSVPVGPDKIFVAESMAVSVGDRPSSSTEDWTVATQRRMAIELWSSIQSKLMNTDFEHVLSLRPEVNELWALIANFKVNYSEARSCADSFFDIVADCMSQRKKLIDRPEEILRTERLAFVRSKLESTRINVGIFASNYDAVKIELQAAETRLNELRSLVSQTHQRYLEAQKDAEDLAKEESSLSESLALSEEDALLLQKFDGLMKNARDLLGFHTLQ